MGNPSVDAFRAYLAAHVDAVQSTMSAALLAQGRRLAEAINQAAPKGKTGKLEHSGQANFGDPAGNPGADGGVVNLRTGQVIPVAQSFAAGTNFAKVVVTAGGADTTKPEKHGKVAEFDYAIATEFGTGRERARPFFYPTFNRMKASIEEALSTAFGESQNAWDAGYGPQVTSADPAE